MSESIRTITVTPDELTEIVRAAVTEALKQVGAGDADSEAKNSERLLTPDILAKFEEGARKRRETLSLGNPARRDGSRSHGVLGH